MVNPKEVLSYPRYDAKEREIDVNDREAAKKDPLAWDKYLVDFIRYRKPLVDSNDNFIGAMSGWRVSYCYGDTVRIENVNLPRNIYGNPLSIEMNHYDFINSVILRGIPVDKYGYIDTSVFFYRINKNQTYQIEVEGSKIYNVFMEAYQKGYHKRIRYLKNGNVYKVLLRKARVIDNGWDKKYSEFIKDEVRELLLISKKAFSISTEVLDYNNVNCFKDFLVNEKPFSPSYDRDGNIGIANTREYGDGFIFKDINDGSYFMIPWGSEKYFFPFEELYKDPNWRGEKAGISVLNNVLERGYPSYLSNFFYRAKNHPRFLEGKCNIDISLESSLIQFAEKKESIQEIVDNSHNIIRKVMELPQFVDIFVKKNDLPQAI